MADEVNKQVKAYTDTYLYSKYPLYSKKLTAAIMQDPTIDKSTEAFKDVIFSIKRARVSDSLVKILQSSNTILLDCDEPLPRAFKVFCAKDFKSPDKKVRAFIDCTGCITKSKSSADLIVDETKLISYLINAAVSMIYHKAYPTIVKRSTLIMEAAECFAKSFTQIIDYLIKISIQETSKAKMLYLSSMYFLQGILDFKEDRSQEISKRIAEISDREASMLNILMDKAAHNKDVPASEFNPFENIRNFVRAIREVMHFNKQTITCDVIVERWMTQYGPGTVFGLEYFPAFSAMMTDCYIGGYINNQRTIENVCKTSMVSYTKSVLDMIENTI